MSRNSTRVECSTKPFIYRHGIIHYNVKAGIAPEAEFVLGTKRSGYLRFSPSKGTLQAGTSRIEGARFSSVLAGDSSIIGGQHNTIIAGINNVLREGFASAIVGSSNVELFRSRNVVISGVDGQIVRIPENLRDATVVQNLHVLGNFQFGGHRPGYQLFVEGNSGFAGDSSFGARVLIADGVRPVPFSRYRLIVEGDQAISGSLDVRAVEGSSNSGHITARSLGLEQDAVINGNLTVRGTINGGGGGGPPFVIDYTSTEPATFQLEPQMSVIYVSTTNAPVTLALPSRTAMEGRDNQRLTVKDVRLLTNPNTTRLQDAIINIMAPENVFIDAGFSTPTGSTLPTYQPEMGGTFVINRDQAAVEFLYNESLGYWALITVFQGSVVQPTSSARSTNTLNIPRPLSLGVPAGSFQAPRRQGRNYRPVRM